MTWDDAERQLSYQRIAELHADAERQRQIRMLKRRRRSRERLGRLLWPIRVAAWANDVIGGLISPRSRRDATPMGRSS
jgi:hypothetical protein